MYKIFNITYNDGGWHSGDLPNFYYIAKNQEEVIANSAKYYEYLKRREKRGGSVWIKEVSGLSYDFEFENLDGFDIEVTVRRKE
jgi:hypothetical protein